MSTLNHERGHATPVKDPDGRWRNGNAGNRWGRAGRPDGRSESVQRRNIREKLAEVGSLPVDKVCARCLACFELDGPDACPRCGGSVVEAPEGPTRENFFLDALWTRAIQNPDGPAARLLMEYRYGRVPLALNGSGEGERGSGTSKTSITLRVVDAQVRPDGSPMPELLRKPMA